MARAAKVIGYAPIYETDRGLQVRRSEIRPGPANNSRYNGYDGYDDDDDFGDDDVDFAGPRRDGRRERRGNRRSTRRANSDDSRSTRHRRQDRREATREANRDSRRGNGGGGGGGCRSENGSTRMAGKMLSGANTASGSGVSSTITIRPQFDFVAKDITFAGADSGAEISSIYFGAVPVWSADTPIPISIFSTSSFKNQDTLEGATIRGGLDIIINYVSGAAAKLTAVVTGYEG